MKNAIISIAVFPGNSNILVADVSDWDVKWPERPESECRDPYPIPELFVDGERYVVAGWPDWPSVAAPGDTNDGWAVVSSFIDKGTRFGSDRKFYDCNSHTELLKMKVVDGPWPGTFGYSGDRPSRPDRALSHTRQLCALVSQVRASCIRGDQARRLQVLFPCRPSGVGEPDGVPVREPGHEQPADAS